MLSDPILAAEVDRIAQKIARNTAPELLELARNIAAAEVDIMRIRRVRGELVSRVLADFNRKWPLQSLSKNIQWGTSRSPDEVLERHLFKFLLRTLKVDKPAVGPEFEIIDRYERRALSRRKFAIRAFDEARAAALTNSTTR